MIRYHCTMFMFSIGTFFPLFMGDVKNNPSDAIFFFSCLILVALYEILIQIKKED